MITKLSERLKWARRLLFYTWFNFAVRYRKTILGPVWILIGPALFVSTLGFLFAYVNKAEQSFFIPYLTTGLITWTLIVGFVTNSTRVFQRNRAIVLQGNMSFMALICTDVMTTILIFAHQVIIIAVVFYIYGIGLSLYSLGSLVGLFLLAVNGLWLTTLLGIVGARYRDIQEITAAVMRIAFLATPIIWLPGGRGVSDIQGRGEVISYFLNYNPFYHFLELVRAPLLNYPINPISYAVVGVITLLGSALAYLFYKRFSKHIPLWV